MITADAERGNPVGLTRDGLADVTLRIDWHDGRARHDDELHIENFSVRRQAASLPSAMASSLVGLCAADSITGELAAGELTGDCQLARQVALDRGSFDRNYIDGITIEPRLGRFYPGGFFRQAHGVIPKGTPVRITSLEDVSLGVDFNHPFCRFAAGLELRIDTVSAEHGTRDGPGRDVVKELAAMIGLKAPLENGQQTDYGDRGEGMQRLDESPDSRFYVTPRFTQHLDARARSRVNALYRRLVGESSSLLDLMASHDSHLQGINPSRLHVLGLNGKELDANPVADARAVQDLNRVPTLPYEDNSMDAVVCTASVEYLTRPRTVFGEVRRILRPGGVFVCTFSNRWFPPKAIRIWSQLHEFERVGLVTQWLRQSGFGDLHTFSSRGWPRPADDPYTGRLSYSDPLHAVWGYRGEP